MTFPAMPIIIMLMEDMNECGKKNSTSFTLTVKSHSRPDCILPPELWVGSSCRAVV